MPSPKIQKHEKKSSLKLIFGGFSVLAIVIAVVAFLMMNSMLRITIEKIGTATLGVPVKVGKVETNLAEKSVIITNLRIANPKGFKEPYALTMGSININLQSISADVLVFNNITVSNTDIYMEARNNGVNLNDLKKNVNSKASETVSKDTKKKPVKVIIKTILIGQSTLHPEIEMLGKDLNDITMEQIKLSDIGTKDNAVLASEAATQILEVIATKAFKKASQEGVLDSLSDDLLDDLGVDSSIAAQITGGIKNLFGN